MLTADYGFNMMDDESIAFTFPGGVEYGWKIRFIIDNDSSYPGVLQR